MFMDFKVSLRLEKASDRSSIWRKPVLL